MVSWVVCVYIVEVGWRVKMLNDRMCIVEMVEKKDDDEDSGGDGERQNRWRCELWDTSAFSVVQLHLFVTHPPLPTNPSLHGPTPSLSHNHMSSASIITAPTIFARAQRRTSLSILPQVTQKKLLLSFLVLKQSIRCIKNREQQKMMYRESRGYGVIIGVDFGGKGGKGLRLV